MKNYKTYQNAWQESHSLVPNDKVIVMFKCESDYVYWSDEQMNYLIGSEVFLKEFGDNNVLVHDPIKNRDWCVPFYCLKPIKSNSL